MFKRIFLSVFEIFQQNFVEKVTANILRKNTRFDFLEKPFIFWDSIFLIFKRFARASSATEN